MIPSVPSFDGIHIDVVQEAAINISQPIGLIGQESLRTSIPWICNDAIYVSEDMHVLVNGLQHLRRFHNVVLFATAASRRVSATLARQTFVTANSWWKEVSTLSFLKRHCRYLASAC